VDDRQGDPDAQQPAANDEGHEAGQRRAAAHVGQDRQAAGGPAPGGQARDDQRRDRGRRRPPFAGHPQQHRGDRDLDEEDRQVGDREVAGVGRVVRGQLPEQRDARRHRGMRLERADDERAGVGCVHDPPRRRPATDRRQREAPRLRARHEP
jgi:hypothetical protein